MKASVIIPNLNGAGWLRDSIESVWAQTEQDFELIVIDNGSTDESLEIARSYRGHDRYTPVSYTHLDVYKRQMVSSGEQSLTRMTS